MKTKNTNCPHIDKPHYGKGMCINCYRKFKYWSNEEYREKEKERMRKAAKKWYKKKCRKNPKWNAKRQKEFRKNHPDAFNYLMAKFYMKKLPQEKMAELLKEIGYGKENNT